MVGNSPALRALKEEIALVASSEARILVTGESGVGKELVGRAVHEQSPRIARPFVVINCAGVPDTLLESELFGHLKGSFTSAYRDNPGRLQTAHRGTMMLDEIGEMTVRMQGLLLRFLETGELQRLGAHDGDNRVDVRIIATTNKDLAYMVSEGTFREDLFYRLNVIHLEVPSLRAREGDVLSLLDHFYSRFTKTAGDVAELFSAEALTLLTQYPWPGNVRELENVVERLVVTSRGRVFTVEDLPSEIRAARSGGVRPQRERRHTIVDDLFTRLVTGRESFWTAVYPLYMQREITKTTVREIVKRGLQNARGNYKIVARDFNMGPNDYKRFLNFLRKHQCQLPFQDYR